MWPDCCAGWLNDEYLHEETEGGQCGSGDVVKLWRQRFSALRCYQLTRQMSAQARKVAKAPAIVRSHWGHMQSGRVGGLVYQGGGERKWASVWYTQIRQLSWKRSSMSLRGRSISRSRLSLPWWGAGVDVFLGQHVNTFMYFQLSASFCIAWKVILVMTHDYFNNASEQTETQKCNWCKYKVSAQGQCCFDCVLFGFIWAYALNQEQFRW